MRRLLAMMCFWSALSACQASGTQDLVVSAASAEITGPAASAIAGDMVSKFAEQIGPGSGTIILKSDQSAFSQALETSLKSWGYALVTEQKTSGNKEIPLAYVLDLHQGQVLARLSTNTVQLGRAYTITMEGALPASPVSLMRRG
jgi:hypothetical protein